MGNGNKVEFLVAVCALVSSIIAIWVAWDQSRVMRAQQDGMVYPVLQLDGFVSRAGETTAIGFSLENSGVGPALIESVVAKRGGETLSSLEPYREALAPGYDTSWTGLTGRAVAPGKSIDALRLEWPANQLSDADLNKAVEVWGEIEIEICYCSVFGKCWISRQTQSRTESVKSCRANDSDIFENFGLTPARPKPAAPQEVPQ